MSPASTIKMTAQQFLELGKTRRRAIGTGGWGGGRESKSDTEAFDCRKMLCRILTNYVFPKGIGEVLGDVDTIFGEHDVTVRTSFTFQKIGCI